MEKIKERMPKEIKTIDRKGRAYLDILEGIRGEYGLDQIELSRILKIHDTRYSDWKNSGKIPSFSITTQPGINVIQFAKLYNKLSSYFATIDGAKSWLLEKSDVIYGQRSPLEILEEEDMGLFIVNNYLESRMNP